MLQSVLPGNYEVSVAKDDWCWNEKTISVTINTEVYRQLAIFTSIKFYNLNYKKITKSHRYNHLPCQNAVVAFQGVGFQLTVSVSHATDLSVARDVPETEGVAEGMAEGVAEVVAEGVAEGVPEGVLEGVAEEPLTLSLSKGTHQQCIAAPGLYRISPRSCHMFQQEVFEWDTAAPRLVYFSAVKHLLTGAVRSSEAAEFSIAVTSASQASEVVPLVASKDDPTTYVFQVYLAEGESVTLTPTSPSDLHQFSPASHALTMPADCLQDAVAFAAERALFIHGRILPALEGVAVSVAGGGVTLALTSDAEGRFTAGPLDNALQYTISAEKKGYVMTPLEKQGEPWT